MYKFMMVLSLLTLVVVSGCASLQRPPEEVVAERAQQRLDALVNHKPKIAYSYASPGYRASVPFEVHHPKIAGSNSWLGAKVKSVECEEDVCTVRTLITYRLHGGKIENTRPMKEKWIKVDGQWWIYHR